MEKGTCTRYSATNMRLKYFVENHYMEYLFPDSISSTKDRALKPAHLYYAEGQNNFWKKLRDRCTMLLWLLGVYSKLTPASLEEGPLK